MRKYILGMIHPFLWRVFGATFESYARKQGMQSTVVEGVFYVYDRKNGQVIATTSGASKAEPKNV